MSRHTGTVTRPRFESRAYRPSPARREFIHGPIRSDLDDRPDLLAPLCRAGVVVFAVAAVVLMVSRGWWGW